MHYACSWFINKTHKINNNFTFHYSSYDTFCSKWIVSIRYQFAFACWPPNSTIKRAHHTRHVWPQQPKCCYNVFGFKLNPYRVQFDRDVERSRIALRSVSGWIQKGVCVWLCVFVVSVFVVCTWIVGRTRREEIVNTTYYIVVFIKRKWI